MSTSASVPEATQQQQAKATVVEDDEEEDDEEADERRGCGGGRNCTLGETTGFVGGSTVIGAVGTFAAFACVIM
jgi:hypothetical protein